AVPDLRDYLTSTIPAGQRLIGLNLVGFAPNNLAFASFNTGNTSFIPSAVTDAMFLAGIHVSAIQLGTNLMPAFVNNPATQNSLPSPALTNGPNSFLIHRR